MTLNTIYGIYMPGKVLGTLATFSFNAHKIDVTIPILQMRIYRWLRLKEVSSLPRVIDWGRWCWEERNFWVWLFLGDKNTAFPDLEPQSNYMLCYSFQVLTSTKINRITRLELFSTQLLGRQRVQYEKIWPLHCFILNPKQGHVSFWIIHSPIPHFLNIT